jgi:hypothetical protein
MSEAVDNGDQGKEPLKIAPPSIEPRNDPSRSARIPTIPKVPREKRVLKFVKDWGGVPTVLIAILYTFPFDAAGKFINWREQNLVDARKALSEIAALYAAATTAVANVQDPQAKSFLNSTYQARIYVALLQNRQVIDAAENRLLSSELYVLGSLYSLAGLNGIRYYNLAIQESKTEEEKVTIYREVGNALFSAGPHQNVNEARVDYVQALTPASTIPYQQAIYIQDAAELSYFELEHISIALNRGIPLKL